MSCATSPVVSTQSVSCVVKDMFVSPEDFEVMEKSARLASSFLSKHGITVA